MKLIRFILIATFLTGLTTCYADVCQYTSGSVKCGLGTIPNITANGLATLQGTTVTNQLTVNGSLTAINASINNLNTNGNNTINNTTVYGKAIITGLLNAENSNFSKTLTLNSNASILIASKTADIAINLSGSTRLSTLCLENNTHTGIITFNTGMGLIYESGGSSTTNVINGQIIQAPCPQN